MKKRIGILFLLMMMVATFVFAAYPEDLENQELENLEGDFSQMNAEGIEPISINPDMETNVNVTDSDVFLSENTVNVTEVINGNVYVMGKDVKLDQAIVYGNVFAMGENVDISNVEINGSVYVMGSSVKFSGTAYDVYAMGESVDFAKETYIWRDIKAFGNRVNLNGNIYRNVDVGANELTVANGTTIEGKLEYTSENETTIPEDAHIGDVKFNQEKMKRENTNYFFEAATQAFKTFIIGLILVFVVTKFSLLKRTENIAMDFVKEAGKGIVTFCIFPIVAFILLITGIGASLGVMTVFFYVILLYIATSLTAVEIANRMVSKMQIKNQKNAKLIGIAILISLVIWGLSFVPVLGVIVQILTGLIGLGILAEILLPMKKEEKNEN